VKFNFTRTQREVIKAICKANGNVWVVGGAVRDTILGDTPKDIDLASDLPLDELETALRTVSGLAPDGRGREHGVLRVIDPKNKELVDVAILRKDCETDGRHATIEPTDSIVADLARRDLTINAMAVSVDSAGNQRELCDPFDGRKHLASKTIELVGKPGARIKEDYLRMLRVARFATKLGPGCSIGTSTVNACVHHAKQIKTVSNERVREEIMKALSYDNAGWMFRYMQKLGLLKHVMPDLHRGVGCKQNKYHVDDVFEHLCHCVDQSILTDEERTELYGDEDKKQFTPLLKLAVLFHDIAKPHTKKIIKGSPTFHNHEVVGATVAYKWMKQYKFSNDEVKYVVKLVRGHQWRFMEDSNEKTYRKWLQKTGKNDWRDLICLRIADRKGNRAKTGRPGMTRHMKDLVNKCNGIISSGQPIFREDLAVDGRDLKSLGVKPGPMYKEIFSNILGIVISDPSKNTKEWLSDYIKRNYTSKQ
jgi:tRNA nucleotidyltransferase/poly(A) polymerase